MTEQGRKIVAAAVGLIGTPYVWGGNTLSDNGLDCSGFAQLCLCVAGIEPWVSRFPRTLDYTADGLWNLLGETLDYPKPGDLAFYGKGGVASHVVIVESAQTVIGASRGHANLRDPEEALRIGAVVRRIPGGVRYRKDFLGVRGPWLRTGV